VRLGKPGGDVFDALKTLVYGQAFLLAR
jgi:hypothetical protein